MKILPISTSKNNNNPNFKANLNITPELKEFLKDLKENSGWSKTQIKNRFKSLDESINDDSITLCLCKKEYDTHGKYNLTVTATDGKFSNQVVIPAVDIPRNGFGELMYGFNKAVENVKQSRGGISKTIDTLV